MKDKLLISTLYNSMNPGARLQAYALYRYLEDKGFDVEFYKGGARKPLKETISNAVGALKQGSITSFFFTVVQYLRFQSLDLSLPAVSATKAKKQFGTYYALICGSDEIWNMKRRKIREYPYLAGQGISIDKKIAYAASTGYSGEEDLIKDKWFETELKKFSAISVREDTSVKLIEDISGKKVTQVLDPVFLVDWESLYKSNPIQCVFIYFSGKLSSDAEIEAVIRFAKKEELQIVTMGNCFCRWADRSLTMDPKAFLYYMFNSAFIVTNTFHGVAFSVVSRHDFIVFDSPSNKKVKSLLKLLHLEDRYINSITDLEHCYRKSIDYGPVEEILNEAKHRSECFLNQSLER